METKAAVANATTSYEEGKKYSASIKGFNYRGDFAMLVVDMNGKNESLIVGTKQDNPIQQIIGLKGLTAEFTYRGMKNVAGKDYPRFSLDCISF